MTSRLVRRSLRGLVVLMGGALLLAQTGCPIDTNALLTDTLQAALQSMTSSFIETLSQQLAGS